MKRKVLFVAPLLLFGLLTGCGSEQNSAVSQVAQRFAQESMSGDWSATIKDSTGEELSILTLLSNELSSASFKSNVRLVQVLSVSVHGSYATATVRVVRDMQVAGYGTATDDREVMYSLYNLNGAWKVYRVDVVAQNQTN